MVYLNDTNDLENELRSVGAEYTNIDLGVKLGQANERLTSIVGRRFIEYKEIRFEDETRVELDFSALESFDKVVRNNEIVDDSNYTVDNTDASVTFTQSYVDDNFSEGLVLEFYYVPRIFRTLELYLAVRNILETEYVNTPDEIRNTETERLNARITAMVNRINGKNSVSVQHGDNRNRGSASPRRFGGGLGN